MHKRVSLFENMDDCRECSGVENQKQEDKKSVEWEVDKKMLDIKSEQK